MKPAEILQGLADGVAKFLQNYVRFILLMLRSPLKQAARQYYRSVFAAEQDISPLAYFFSSAFLVAILPSRYFELVHFEMQGALDGVITRYSPDALLPTTIAALTMTIAFDSYAFAFYRGGSGVKRSARIHGLVVLTGAAAVFWSHLAYAFGNQLGWVILFDSHVMRLVSSYARTEDVLLHNFAWACGQMASLLVTTAFFTPVAAYAVRSRPHSRAPARLRVRLFSVCIGIILVGLDSLRGFLSAQLEGRVSATYVSCGIRKAGSPMTGAIVVKNTSSSDRLIYLGNWKMTVTNAVFLGPPGGQSINKPNETWLLIEEAKGQDAIILKQGETRLFHYKTISPYIQNADAKYLFVDERRGCPVTMDEGRPL